MKNIIDFKDNLITKEFYERNKSTIDDHINETIEQQNNSMVGATLSIPTGYLENGKIDTIKMTFDSVVNGNRILTLIE